MLRYIRDNKSLVLKYYADLNDSLSTNNEQVEKLTREYIIHYRVCIGSLIYLLFTRVDLNFSVHKLEKFQQILVRNTLKD